MLCDMVPRTPDLIHILLFFREGGDAMQFRHFKGGQRRCEQRRCPRAGGHEEHREACHQRAGRS